MVNEEEQLKEEIKQLKQQLIEGEPEEKKDSFWEIKPSEKKKLFNVLIPLLIVILIGGSLIYYLDNKGEGLNKQLSELKQSSSELKQIADSAKSHETQAINYDKTSNDFYDTAMFSFERKDWVNAYTNCQKARDYASKSGEEYRLAKAKWEQAYNLIADTELKSKLDVVIKMNNAGSEIQYNQYEACEGIETASHYFLQNDILMGNQYLESANEKIKLHDYWVTVYNENVAKRKA